MDKKLIYAAPESELLVIRFEENILLSGVDTQNTTVSNPFEGTSEEEW